nr:MAG TPA: hypothetical protein [Caudoviricetes sp.]
MRAPRTWGAGYFGLVPFPCGFIMAWPGSARPQGRSWRFPSFHLL